MTDAGYDPRQVKLLRHNAHGAQAWAQGRDHFLSFASVQSADASPFATNPRYVAHFLPGLAVPGGGFAAYFVGMTELHGRWPWDPGRLPRVWVRDYLTKGKAAEAADQSWMPSDPGLPTGLIIDWGAAPRSWHQWATMPKPVIPDGAGLPELEAFLPQLGTAQPMDAETRALATLDYETRELAARIARNPEAVERAFRTGRHEVRPEQAQFRKALLDRYGRACCMTGCTVPEALEAAHIIPFAEAHAERDMPSNGLLLRRDVHRLFDLGMISVAPDSGTIWIAEALEGSSYAVLRGKPFTATASRDALQVHFDRAFELAHS